ncbi:MAG TPA: xanthine dehydrogenase family protein subunit M [Burkholderiaceae bacterium]|nr:xanthine dehydrogenase family protein subunit M [Burkholderiaceae bacterium]
MYSFEYQKPASLADAVKAGGGDARFLAGGQSLVQSMKLRLASASTLVDLGGLAELRGIQVSPTEVTIGAAIRHAEVAASADVRQTLPALADLASVIGDPMVRNMGTLGGSLANADPAADYPAAVLALNATIRTDRRTIAADDFFKGLYETALQPGEIIVSVTFPVPEKAGYEKLRQPASRFALVGVFVAKTAAGVRVGVTGAKASAFRATPIEQALAANFTADAAAAVKMPDTDINTDLHGSAQYRAAMISVIASRAVAKANA